jgi:hypothetical protein
MFRKYDEKIIPANPPPLRGTPFFKGGEKEKPNHRVRILNWGFFTFEPSEIIRPLLAV